MGVFVAYQRKCDAVIDNEKASLVVVASTGHGAGVVLWYAGSICFEFDAVGSAHLDDYGLDDCPIGIHVWEGCKVVQR